jgi:NAD(P) transhydrogenase subunit beta
VNGLLFLGSLAVGVIVVLHHGADPLHVSLIFALALLFGVAMTLPIGGADMPVVISLYNALTGLAVAFEGFVMNNAAMIIAGTVVGSAGTLLTQLMAKAMNRSLANVLFSDFGSGGGGAATAVSGSMKPIEASDVGVMMAFASKVIVVPGYGMAVAQAQHKVWEMCQLLIERGVDREVRHPPGGGPHARPHERAAGRSRRSLRPDLRPRRDQRRVRNRRRGVDHRRERRGEPGGAHRQVQPHLWHADPERRQGQERDRHQTRPGRGFSGIENALFFLDNTRMLYGDGQKAAAELVNAIKAVG